MTTAPQFALWIEAENLAAHAEQTVMRQALSQKFAQIITERPSRL